MISKKYFYHKIYYSSKNNLAFGQEYADGFHRILPKHNMYIYNKELVCSGTVLNDTAFLVTKKGTLLTTSVYKDTLIKIGQTTITDSKDIFYQFPYFYIAGYSGVTKYNRLTKKIETFLPDNEIVKIKINPFNKNIYILTSSALYEQKKTTLIKLLDINATKRNGSCMDMAFMPNEEIALASRKGLYIISKSNVLHLNSNNGFPTEALNSIYYSLNYNCLFVGTTDKGLLKLEPKTLKTISHKIDNKTFSVYCILQTKDNKILFNENVRNIYELKNDKQSVYVNADTGFTCLKELNNLLLAGTWGRGILILENGKVVQSVKKPLIANNTVISLFIDKLSQIWIGNLHGISKGNSITQVKPFHPKTVINKICTIIQRKNGDICLGGADGIYITRKDSIIDIIGKKEGLICKEVRALYEDSEQKLWIGTYNGGIYCYYNKTLVHVNSKRNCKLGDDAFCFAEDDFGYLYITSNNGLWRIKFTDLNDFLKNKKDFLIPFHYTEDNGISNTEFNGGVSNTYLKAKDGKFYFPTIEGIVVTKPEKLFLNKANPIIDKIYVNNTLIDGKNNKFKKTTTSIQFEFSSVDFLSKYNTYFQYKLIDNNKSEWSNPFKTNSVNLNALSPGNYTFCVRAIDGFNDSKPNEVVYAFEIEPYFYETLLFKIIIGLLIATVSFLIPLYFYNQKKERQLFSERYNKKLSELELKSIQSRLNPHFIFNCMNTLKYLILKENYNKANDGLNKLSFLIRNSIEKSNDFFLPLSEELYIIKNYLDLERLRLSDEMGYIIEIDGIETEKIIVPSLIFQTYVENAIKHGVSNLTDRKGLIKITITIKSSMLICIIEDNGIGRKKSGAFKSIHDNATSLGTILTFEKCYFLKNYLDYNIDIKIEDLYSNEIASGTKITLEMPIKYDSSNN